MPRNNQRRRPQLKNLFTTALAFTIVGIGSVPAHAESVRDKQWHLDAMHAEEMWKTSRGEGITVAVIDTGVDKSLPDLKGQIIKGKDFSVRSGDEFTDYDGHGTRMAVLIAANGGAGPELGSFGVAPESKILPLRVDAGSNGKNEKESIEQFDDDVAPAIRYAADSTAKVINISLAAAGTSKNLRNAVNYALSKGKIVFAGVGNSGHGGNEVKYPAATPGVIGVSALDQEAGPTKESQHGKQVDLSAPGMEIYGACSGGSELCTSHGTSDATAIASASAALVWAKHPDWTANQVTRVMVNTAGSAENGEEWTNAIGYGAVRPRIALKNPGDPGDPDTNPLPGPYSEKNAAKNKKPAESDDKPAKNQGTTTAQNKDADSDANWLAYGLGTAGLIAAGGATALFIRHRRRTTR